MAENTRRSEVKKFRQATEYPEAEKTTQRGLFEDAFVGSEGHHLGLLEGVQLPELDTELIVHVKSSQEIGVFNGNQKVASIVEPLRSEIYDTFSTTKGAQGYLSAKVVLVDDSTNQICIRLDEI